jgi:hypothetical protein
MHAAQPYLRSYWQLVIKSTCILWTQFITVFTIPPLISIPNYHPVPQRRVLISSSHIHLELPSGISSSGFHTRNLHKYLFSTMHATFSRPFQYLESSTNKPPSSFLGAMVTNFPYISFDNKQLFRLT